MLKKQNVVTCFYCEYHELLYTNDDASFFDKDKGVCHLKNINRLANDSICDCFILKPGIYTQKWYPGKKGKF